MLRASKVSALIDLDGLPLLPGVADLLARGIRSTYHAQNSEGRRGIALAAGAGHPALEALFDPQTSGGILFGIAADRAGTALDHLRAAGVHAAIIGEVTHLRPDQALFSVTMEPPGQTSNHRITGGVRP
jgi:selenide,water dikinase